MPYRRTAVRIQENIQSPETLGPGQSVTGEKKRSHGLQFSAAVDRIDGPFLGRLFCGKTTHSAEPASYEGEFLTAIRRAIESCESTGYEVEHHFRGVTKMNTHGKGESAK